MEPTKEVRIATLALEERASGNVVTGYASTFEPYQIGRGDFAYIERVERGAFSNVHDFDVRLLWGHDTNQVLARSNKGKGTLKLEAREDGLYFEAPLPNTQLGRDAKELIQRGDVSGASFGFTIGKQHIDKNQKPVVRTILAFSNIFDVSLTAFPANPTTAVGLRDLLNAEQMEPTTPSNPAPAAPAATTAPAAPAAEPVEVRMVPGARQVPQAPSGGGMTARDREALHSFSLVRAARIAAGWAKADGLEGEIFNQGERELRSAGLLTEDGRAAFYFPPSMMEDLRQLRNQTVTGDSGTKGGKTVQTSVGTLIDLFLPNPVVARCGARVITGLQDNMSYPVENATWNGAWATETGEIAYEDVTLAARGLSPKRMGAGGATSRMLLAQSTIDVESWMATRMRQALDRLFDRAAIKGGGANEPLGILGTPRSATPADINTILEVPFSKAAAYASLIAGEVGLAGRDALDPRAVYLGRFETQGLLKNTKIDAGSGRMVLEGLIMPQPKTANGYDFFASNLVPKIGTGTDELPLIFGDFSEGLILATWGTPVLIVDPYTDKRKSLVGLHLEQFADVLVRKPDAFVVFPNADAA
jgi:HK97 family phage major capsid protein/HK97 family phage prohead protease